MKYIVDALCVRLQLMDGVATVDCWVKGDYLDATKAKVIAELQVKSGSGWLPVGLWTDTQNDYMAWVYRKSISNRGSDLSSKIYSHCMGRQSIRNKNLFYVRENRIRQSFSFAQCQNGIKKHRTNFVRCFLCYMVKSVWLQD